MRYGAPGNFGSLRNELRRQGNVAAFLLDASVAVYWLGGCGEGVLSLVIIGIYSVTAYNVSLRTHEIGIRMALGAQRGDVLRLVLRQGGKVIGMGLVLGLFGGWCTTRLIQNQLWGVKPTDPWTFAVVIAMVFAIGMVACFFPACFATNTAPPRSALRHE